MLFNFAQSDDRPAPSRFYLRKPIVTNSQAKAQNMKTKRTLIYWKSDKFWLGKLLERPEIMTQGETLEELEENIKDAQILMKLDCFFK